LDGKVVTPDSPEYQRFQPPLHQGCRCIWIGICQDDPHIPEPDWPDIPPDLLTQYATIATKRTLISAEKIGFMTDEIEKLASEVDDKTFTNLLSDVGAKAWVEDSWYPECEALKQATANVILKKKYVPDDFIDLGFGYKWKGSNGEWIYERNKDLFHRFAARLYKETQETLGKGRIRLFRGTVRSKLVPTVLTSWTESPDFATAFGMFRGEDVAHVIEIEVDKKHILTCYRSHPRFFRNIKYAKEMVLMDSAFEDPTTKIKIYPFDVNKTWESWSKKMKFKEEEDIAKQAQKVKWRGLFESLVRPEWAGFELAPTREISEKEWAKFVEEYGQSGWVGSAKSGKSLVLKKAANEVILKKKWEPVNIFDVDEDVFEVHTKKYRELYKHEGDLVKAGVRRLYEETQSKLEGKRFKLYRGMGHKDVVVDSISSWTERKSIARKFAKGAATKETGYKGYVLEMEVDAKYILTCYKTHPDFFGKYQKEKEFIVLDEAIKDPRTKIRVVEEVEL